MTERPPVPDEDNSALEKRLRRRERELEAIRRITAALHARTNLDELERNTLEVAIEVVDGDGGTIYVHEEEKRKLVFRYVVSRDPAVVQRLTGMEMDDTRGIAGEVFQTRESRVTVDVAKDDRHNRGIDQQTAYTTKSIISVPIVTFGNRAIGVLQVVNRLDGEFDEEDRAVLEIIGAQAGSALENARLYEEARRASVINLIGDISHDVKNMLTPVVTGTQTLELMMDSMYADLEELAAVLNEEQRTKLEWAVGGVRDFYKEAMQMVYDGAEDAQERVREIADAIKGIVAQPHFELTEFRERAESVARVLKIVAERKDIAIDLSGIGESGPMELDRKGIYNALYNLINNAIQAFPDDTRKGVITLSSRPLEVDGVPGLEVIVRDNGPGMPPHVRERMFTDHAVSTKVGGTGLGTRIVKNVVDAHHGTIRVDSELGKGTTFTIWLPMRQPSSRAQQMAA